MSTTTSSLVEQGAEVSPGRAPQVEAGKLVAVMEQEMQKYLQSVMAAVNNAPDGAWLAGSEEQVRDLSAEFRRRVFEQAVQMRIDAAEAAFSPPHNPATGKRLANKGQQRHGVLTINGRVALRRRWWHSSDTGSLAPADEFIDPQGETVTPGVRELACRENRAVGSFDTAAENLARTAQIKMCGEQLRQIVLSEGRRVQAAQQAATLPTAWTAKDCLVPEEGRELPGKTRVYMGTDGVMVPIITQTEKEKRRTKVKQKRKKCGKKCRPLPPAKKGADKSWKEFKVVFFYSEDNEHQHVSATHRNHIAAGQLVRREADRLGFRQASERIANVDGAPWIREQLTYHLAELDGLGLDFYHLSENVHRARRKVYGEESAEGQTWAAELMHCFKHEGYEAAWERLVPWRAKWNRSPKKTAAAQTLLNFVSDRREMICYPQFREQGWQIGSGPTEAQCKLTVGRLKGRGRRWDRPNASAIAALDCLHRSGQWSTYFPTPSPAAA